jgi:hypothetical protein
MGDAAGKDARLARAGAGDDEEGPVHMADGFLLGRGQTFE